MSNSEILVTTIGTCRLADPLSTLVAAPAFGIRRNDTNVYGFVHTAREALQQLNYINGKELPPELARYIAVSGKFAQHRKPKTSDIFLIEVSSRKEVILDGIYLQTNYIERNFKDRPQLLQVFWKNSSAADRSSRAQLLREIPAFAACDDIDQHMLLDAYMELTTLQTLEQTVLTLRERILQPLVFVSHINARTQAGKLMKARIDLSRWLRTIAARHSITLFDPTPHVNAIGAARALENNGKDLNHYAPDFLLVMGRILYDVFFKPIREVKGKALDMKTLEAASAPPLPPLSKLRTLISLGKFDLVNPLIEERLAVNPDDAEALLLRARVWLELKRPGDAVPLLDRVREAMPQALEPMILLVRALMSLNQRERCAQLAGSLLQDWASDPRALSTAAKAFRKLHEYGAAARALQALVEFWPNDVKPRFDLVEMLLRARDYERAETEAGAALQLDPTMWRLHILRAKALLRLTRPIELAECGVVVAQNDAPLAAEIAEKLMKLRYWEGAAQVAAALPAQQQTEAVRAPLIAALVARGKELLKQSDFGGAAAAFRALALVDPENRHAKRELRQLLQLAVGKMREVRKSDDRAAAMETVRQALELAPDDERVVREAALAAEWAEDWGLATQMWRHLADIGTDAAGAMARAARMAVKAEDFEAAIAIWHRFLAAFPADAEALRMLGWTLRQAVQVMRKKAEAGELDVALLNARIVLEQAPDNRAALQICQEAEARALAALREVMAGRDDRQTEAAARKVLLANPRSAVALKALARTLERCRRFQEAVVVYESLAMETPDNAAAWLKVCKLHQKLRNPQAASAAAERALEVEPDNAEARELAGVPDLVAAA